MKYEDYRVLKSVSELVIVSVSLETVYGGFEIQIRKAVRPGWFYRHTNSEINGEIILT